MKTTYTATFPNGVVITRNSDKDYKFAWRISSTIGFEITGFSSTKQNAQKTAVREANMRHYKPTYGNWIIEVVEAFKEIKQNESAN